jgi:hypothetical protein
VTVPPSGGDPGLLSLPALLDVVLHELFCVLLEYFVDLIEKVVEGFEIRLGLDLPRRLVLILVFIPPSGLGSLTIGHSWSTS